MCNTGEADLRTDKGKNNDEIQGSFTTFRMTAIKQRMTAIKRTMMAIKRTMMAIKQRTAIKRTMTSLSSRQILKRLRR